MTDLGIKEKVTHLRFKATEVFNISEIFKIPKSFSSNNILIIISCFLPNEVCDLYVKILSRNLLRN